jgi:hypothetical protein
MSTFLAEAGLAQRIASHNTERGTFRSWEERTQCAYDVVDQSMEPSRSVFWGYCEEHKAFFISTSVSPIVRIAILQIEEYRRSHKVPHLTAVQFGLSQPTNIPPVALEGTLHTFYAEAWDPDTSTDDIIATEQYLAQLL